MREYIIREMKSDVAREGRGGVHRALRGRQLEIEAHTIKLGTLGARKVKYVFRNDAENRAQSLSNE